jgi:hypothetical protein
VNRLDPHAADENKKGGSAALDSVRWVVQVMFMYTPDMEDPVLNIAEIVEKGKDL